MNGDEALRQQCLALTRADDEVCAAGNRPRTVGHRRHRLVDRGRRHVRARHSVVISQTRSGVMGSARTRAPMTFATALAIAPAVGTHGGSPTPFEPFGPAFGVSVSIQATSICGASETVTSL